MLDSRSSAAVEAAVAALRGGEVVVYPTETLYGLGVDATNADALARLVALKGRRDGKAISVLIDGRDMLTQVCDHLTPLADRLIARFWPGPLTLVVAARASLSEVLTANSGTIGVRWSSCSIAAALVTRLGRPLTAPSANPSDMPPALSVDQARSYFGERVAYYLDGGPCLGGVGSTVVDATGDTLRVLREGAIPAAALRSASVEAA
ncbi:MAG TPA: L-threonylcarbamoyladenylate synthase [Candidatus Kryptonia bacterium]|nr:L-threonylcarbamoyladenylate synthase [Candidatus Kryptonia bacterium]